MMPGRGPCAQTLAETAAAGPSKLRAAAAAHRACPPSTRASLRSDPDLLVRWAPPTAAAARSMAADPVAGVRAAVAASSACSVPDLRRLARDPESAVRVAVASNPATPGKILALLTTDDDYHVQRRVAANPHAPWWSLEYLARGVGGDLLEELAANPSTSPDLLNALVWGDCLCRGGCEMDGECRWNAEMRELVIAGALANPASPRDLITEICDDADTASLDYATARVGTNPQTLDKLAAHPDSYVRAEAAANPRTPAVALRRLSAESDDSVISHLVSNPNCPPETLTELTSRLLSPRSRRRIAANPSCPPETVARLSEDQEARSAAVSNPNCPSVVLAAAASDPDESVRVAAAANPETPTVAISSMKATHGVTDAVRVGLAARTLQTPRLLR